MKQTYVTPSVCFTAQSEEDILIGSDLVIDIGELYSEDEDEEEE